MERRYRRELDRQAQLLRMFHQASSAQVQQLRGEIGLLEGREDRMLLALAGARDRMELLLVRHLHAARLAAALRSWQVTAVRSRLLRGERQDDAYLTLEVLRSKARRRRSPAAARGPLACCLPRMGGWSPAPDPLPPLPMPQTKDLKGGAPLGSSLIGRLGSLVDSGASRPPAEGLQGISVSSSSDNILKGWLSTLNPAGQ